MKTIATIAASLLLSLGALAAPASATDGKQPSGSDQNPAASLTECEQSARTAQKLGSSLAHAEATIVELLAVNSGVVETNTRLVRKVARKDARIQLLKEKLARARSN